MMTMNQPSIGILINAKDLGCWNQSSIFWLKHKTKQEDVRHVSERYIAKSDLFIVMVSIHKDEYLVSASSSFPGLLLVLM